MYKQGWCGINIDLNPLTIELFNFFRTKDININAAISDKEEIKTLYFINELNTQNTLEANHLSFLEKHHNIKQEEITKQENIKSYKVKEPSEQVIVVETNKDSARDRKQNKNRTYKSSSSLFGSYWNCRRPIS